MDEGGELALLEVSEEFPRKLLDDGVHLGEESQAGRRDLGPDHALVTFVALLFDELEGAEAGEEPGDVGLGGDHAIADG